LTLDDKKDKIKIEKFFKILFYIGKGEIYGKCKREKGNF